MLIARAVVNVSPTSPAVAENIAISALKAALNSSSDCVIITDHEERVLFMNTRAKRVLRKSDDVLGSLLPSLISFTHRDATSSDIPLATIVERQE